MGYSKDEVYIFYAETSNDELREQQLDEFEHIKIVNMDSEELEKYISNNSYLLTQYIYLKYKEKISY